MKGTRLQVDQRVLKVVERGLELKVPTRVRHMPYLTGEIPVFVDLELRPRASGQYGRIIGGRHEIEVRTGQSRYDADVTLNHELRHAHQLERLGGPEQFRRLYDQSTRIGCWNSGCGCLSAGCMAGYYRNSYEREARYYERWQRHFHGGVPKLHKRPSRGIMGRLSHE